MTFYHGSVISDIKELSTCSLTHDDAKSSAVYLTPNRAYALFYIRDLEINHVTCGVTVDGYIRYDEQFPNQLMKLYKGVSGYLYHCKGNSKITITATRDVWVSKKPVIVDKAEFIPDVYEEILKNEAHNKIKVIRYETLAASEKQRYYDMAVSYIYKNNLLNTSTKKSAFWQESFPEAWEYVHVKKSLTDVGNVKTSPAQVVC